MRTLGSVVSILDRILAALGWGGVDGAGLD